MKSYTDKGRHVVEVSDLSFLYDRERFCWLGREWRHFRLKKALKTADQVIAADERAASDVHKYYRFPTEKIDLKTSPGTSAEKLEDSEPADKAQG